MKDLEKPESERQVYLPTSFSDMVGYLSYCMRRRDLLTDASSRGNGVAHRYFSYMDLLSMKEMYKSESLRDLAIRTKQKIKIKRNNNSAIRLTTTATDLNNTKDNLMDTRKLLENVLTTTLENNLDTKSDEESEVDYTQEVFDRKKHEQEKITMELLKMKKKIEEEAKREVKKSIGNISKLRNDKLRIKENMPFENFHDLDRAPSTTIDFRIPKKINLGKTTAGKRNSSLGELKVPRSIKYMDTLMRENMKIIKNSEEVEKFKKFIGKPADVSSRQIKFHHISGINKSSARASPQSSPRIKNKVF